MEWLLRADLPIYSQLVEQIKLAIASGAFAPGERLASVRDLAAQAGVNPNTMQRALQELEREDLVFSQRTSGRFVTEDAEAIGRVKRTLAEDRIRELLAALGALGYGGEEIISLIRENVKDVKEESDEQNS